ncbi:hypothetical protein [Candidatus Thiodictyon syntrophicum]|jgi:hypothetical protein|uniref:Uncharacterized protein n=1 Tax=Candidatus Thiodictyon syntrophicum TaxID=1166950 RepID=A0A2K8UAA1_9GAMM|nr:hypothetical protein [Candidatus Thiodictyon syntrophicum]AUB82508.1 hypothetical protein THSYN_17190 [Candidatus Thiodictyon syntrophicum]
MPRPTLLIGFGAYGLDALQRLLHQSALRGVLRWQETQSGGVASAQRHLRDLALLALPDPFERSAVGTAVGGAGAPQFLTDLYRQIKAPAADQRTEPGAAAALVRRIADALVAQTSFDRRDPVGLDLIVLARPGVPDAIPHLDILLQHCLESLADSSFFKVAVQGAANLNCILILDFDDYWQGAGAPAAVATARSLRAALRNSMQGWERRRSERQAGVERCYLVDGRTAVGYRPPHVRLDEAVLFLELLLFEGLRTTRQALYQQASLAQPVTATFGIRLLEESTLVRSREAAATFGRRWLDALIGDQEQCPDRQARRVRETLAPLRWEAIERRIDDGRLEDLFDVRAEQLVSALTAVPEPQTADWPERVQEVFARERQALGQALDRAGWEIVTAIKEAHLKDLDQRVVDAVDADLHDDRAPASLTLVRAALDEVRRGLADGADRGRLPVAQSTDPLQRLGVLHRQYRAQLDEWLTSQGRALQWFWPLFALVLALGLAALSVRLVYEINPPGRDWLDALVQALRTMNHPLSWTLVWFVLLWAVLALRVQPLITGRIARAQRFYSSAQRGRFHDHLRDLVDPLRESLLARVRRNLRASLTNEVQKTLTRIGERLAERGREMVWLRRQLAEFLRLSSQPAMAVRHWVRGAAGLETIMAVRPLERICYPQDDLPRPFAGWSEHYCDAFLDPLRFIDILSKRYADAEEEEQARRTAADDWPQRRRELIDFIDDSKLAPACRFLQDTGVAQERRWCIAAPRWRAIPGMVDELNNRLGIIDEDIVPAADRSRVYLLVLQTGVAAVNLERGEGWAGF